jgi:pSer/pThr/pTyr-binding forkhead associated (FHA) protein
VLFNVPYSRTLQGYAPVQVPLRVQVDATDDVPRDPVQVSYFANGLRIGTSTTPPVYEFTWDLSRVVTPTNEAQSQQFTLVAVAEDAYLDGRVESSPVSIRINWEAREYTSVERATAWLAENWWLLLILSGLGIGVLVLLGLLIRTRNEMTRRVIARTTGVLKGVTRRLGGSSTQTPGRLVVVQGANIGREFRITVQTLKVGRDPQFCDFALYDEYVSNPHFSIHREHDRFYITDDGSSNGTQVNGDLIPPHERVLLEPDALIEVGHTLLQFRSADDGSQQAQDTPEHVPEQTSQSRTTQPVSRNKH